MKTKINVISATLIIALAIGITAYAHGPNGGNQGGYGMDGNVYAMMGGNGTGNGMMGGYGSGHGMMGGYGSGHGMMDGYGHNENGHNSRDYRQNNPKFRAESESLINEIDEKRIELSSLLLSNEADKALIDKKVEELNRLERYLDERIQ
jgi:hypothetical protein